MAQLSIKIETYFDRALSAVEKEVALWSDAKRLAFQSDWDALMAAGAEMCDVRFINGRIVAHPSEDLTRFLADRGIHLV